jgi:hypothetical protein
MELQKHLGKNRRLQKHLGKTRRLQITIQGPYPTLNSITPKTK